MEQTDRGSGRTTQALKDLLKQVVDGPEPRLGFYVTVGKHMDDYCFRIIAGERKDAIKQYSMANRMIIFNNDARVRFINWDDDFLFFDGRNYVRVAGYRPDIPVVWDHHALERWWERQIARNRPMKGRPEKKS